MDEARIYANKDHNGCSTHENEVDGYQIRLADLRVDKAAAQLVQDAHGGLMLVRHTSVLAMRPLHRGEGTSSSLSKPGSTDFHVFDDKPAISQLIDINVQKYFPS